MGNRNDDDREINHHGRPVEVGEVESRPGSANQVIFTTMIVIWCLMLLGYWQKPCRREWKGSAQSFDRFLWKVNLGGKPNWSGPLKIRDLELKMLQIWGRRWSSAWKGVRGEFVLVLVCFSISRSKSKEKYPGSPWSTTPFWVWRLWSSTGPSVFPMLMPSNHERGHSDREACLAPVPISPTSVCPISNSVRQGFL